MVDTIIDGKVMVAILPQQNLGSLSRRVSSNCFTRHIRGRAGLFLLFPDTPYTTPEDEQRHGVVAPVIFPFYWRV